MSHLHSFILSSLSLLVMLSAHANPMDTPLEIELSELLENDEIVLEESQTSEEDDLAFEDEALPENDLGEIDQEILVLEEELKRDANELQSSSSELVVIESPALQPSPESSPLQSIESVASSPIESPFLPPPSQISASESIAISPESPKESVESESIAPNNLNNLTAITPIESPLDSASPISPAEVAPLHLFAERDSFSPPQENLLEDPASLEITEVAEPTSLSSVEIDIQQAFAGAPIIYSILLTMSTIAFCIWLYHLFSLKKEGEISDVFLKNLKNRLNSNHFDDALSLCLHHENLFSKMVASGINTRKHGLPTILESMKAEGKRASVHFWQRIGLLNDIAIIAPMLGLLGTVLGMFYAFYDLNRSIESISSLFDGLGISVGTTVAGLVVAILALILHSVAKYRLVKVLARVENEAQSLGTLIDNSKN